jgi:hypothetical protein
MDLGRSPADVAKSAFSIDDTTYEISETMRAAATAYCPWTYQAVSATGRATELSGTTSCLVNP